MSLRHWLEYESTEKFLKGLKLVPKLASDLQYFITGGARVEIWQKGFQAASLEAGAQVALNGENLASKHMFVDCILGFFENPVQVDFCFGDQKPIQKSKRKDFCSIIGRSPLLVGQTLKESLLFRTTEVSKTDLLKISEQFLNPELREKFQNEDFSLFSLSAKEHMEVAVANLFLQKTPIVVFDLGSELMHAATSEGFQVPKEVIQSGKTVFWILPTAQDLKNRGELQTDPMRWAEERTGVRFTLALDIFS